MSETIDNLRLARGIAWADLVPAIDHAIMQAQESEYIADQAANMAQCSVSPVYPPLVMKLAASIRKESNDD